MTRYHLTEPAERDFEEILSYIAANDPNAAARLHGRIVQAMELLGDWPDAGPTLPHESNNTLRYFTPHHSYVIIYQASPKPVQIIRIIHSHRDISQLLHEAA